MDVNDLISTSVQLFNKEKYAEAIETLHQAWDAITDKNTQITEQSWIQTGLGHCYFEQAMKAKNTDKAGKLFELAVEHYQEWLQLAKQLTGEQGSVQQQINARSWLGHCYFEHAKKTKDTDKAGKLFEQAATSFEQQLQLSEQLENDIWQKKARIWKLNTRYLLGRCFFEQARINKDKTEYFIKFVDFFNELREEILNINKEEKRRKENSAATDELMTPTPPGQPAPILLRKL